MPSYLDNLDIEFGWTGDFSLNGGDIRDTSYDGLQSLLDQIHSICASMYDDWEIYPNRSAGLDDFVGEPNTRATANRIRERIIISLVGADLVNEEDINVRIVPVHINKVLAVIRVAALPTPFNQLESGQFLQTSIVFDSTEQQVFFLDKTPQLINT